MSSNSKVGLGYEIQSNNEVLSYEEEMNFSVFKGTEEDSVGKPLYSRFIKANDFKGVPHPLSGDYTPKPQEEIDESLYVYGKKGPQEPEPSVSDDRSSEYSTCQSNDSAGSIGTSSEHSVDPNPDFKIPLEGNVSTPITTNEKGVSAPKSKEVEPSCVSHIKTPRQPIKDQATPKVNRKNWNAMMERELGEDCDYYEKKMAREAEVKKQRVCNTGNMMAKPVWTNTNRINHANQFVPRPVQLKTDLDSQYLPGHQTVLVLKDLREIGDLLLRPQQVIIGGTLNQTPIVTDHPLKNMVDRGIFDSGCSGHMTGNKDQLEDFEEFNGGSVTFGGSKGYISGKGKIRTATANTLADGTLELHATIDTTVYTITKASIRNKLQLADASGITMLPKMRFLRGLGQWVKNILIWPQSQPSSSTIPVHIQLPTNTIPPPITALLPASTPTPIPETNPEPMEHTFEEPSPAHQHFSPPQEHAQGQMTCYCEVGQEGEEAGRYFEKEKFLSDSEEEEPEAQGRKSQDDPLVSLVQGLVTPSKTTVNASGEEQVEDISPTTLEAAKTLSRVASQKPKSIDKGRRYKRRKETKGKKVVTSLDFQEEVSTGYAEGVNTGSIKVSTVSGQVSTVSGQVSTDSIKKSIPSPDKGQREGKAPMIIEEAPKKTKEQILQEEASLAEAIRLDTLEKEEKAKQVHLDSLLAQRLAEEEELNEQQKQRRAQVQFEAQHYTDEDWDLIRAKIEANAELSKSVLGSGLQGEDFAKKMVELVEELQTKTSKRLKSDEAKDDESTKKTGKRRKQIARKGLHSDKTDEDESEASKDADPISGTNISINPVPVAIKPPSIATYKIIKQGKKSVYQIVRENGTDIVYINFGAMLKDITRDDLTELYRIVMNRYGMNGLRMSLEKVCKAMLDKKLQGGKPDEDCYKLLKMMEKQAGIRKHKDWLVQEQTALGKDFSNPLMADNLPKIVWLSTHHICDDEESNHEDVSDTDAAPKQQQRAIPQTTAISNIKLPILKKEEYDIWSMEIEHYLEYIDNDVWKVIQNGNSKKRISTGKDGIVRILSPVTAAEIQAVEKERKAKNILLMAIPKEHMRRFHGMDDAKEIWEAIRTSLEGLEKGYDRFQQLLSQLEAHGAEVSTEDANHKFLRSLPPAWSNLAMTMRTKPDVDTLSIDDLYNNLRVFEQEIQGASKTSSSAQNVAFVSQSKSSTNKVKSGFTGAYSTCTPSTSSTNIHEKEVLAGFADEKFYKKTGRRVRVDGKTPVGFDKKKLECFNCHNTGHFARECTAKGTHDGKKKRDSFYQHQEAGKQGGKPDKDCYKMLKMMEKQAGIRK
ncbi:ribonuclease H-like domain-containing protein [Tanacetum coccineum]